MRVTIIGPGNMGRALTARLLAGGNQVILVGDRQQAEEVVTEFQDEARAPASIEAGAPEEAITSSEVVILALPYEVIPDILRQYGSFMDGKIVVEISNPLDESYSKLLTEGGPSAAERIRSLLPESARVVKAFNTTFARTLVGGKVSGQPLDVLIAGDDRAANEKVVQLVRGGEMRPIPVGGLERARQLEGLGFLGISIQEQLGTGFMTGWKLVFPGTEPPEGTEFPRRAVVGVMPDTKAVGQIVTELAAIGIEESEVRLIMGAEGVAALRNAQRGSDSILGWLFGYEAEHTRRHLEEVEAGHVVIVVEVEDDNISDRVGAVLARHGAGFLNYYSRWSSRRLLT